MLTEALIRVVDDDRRFLTALQGSLRALQLTVAAYTGARAFLAAYDPRRPGCLLCDLRMPEVDGLTLQRLLCAQGQRLPVIFVTGHGDVSSARAAFRFGAVDFLEKPFRERQLLDSVRKALIMDARDRALARDAAATKERYARLSPRERQVFALVVSDLPNKRIARELAISPRTVEHHRERVMMKMRAASLADLITMAVLCGVRDLHLGLSSPRVRTGPGVSGIGSSP